MLSKTPDAPLPHSLQGDGAADRHRLSTRLWHWTNAIAVVILLMSGLTIFNAHPRLYWGIYGANADHAWLEIGANEGGGGYLRVADLTVPTTGVLGESTDQNGTVRMRAFPWWATIPQQNSLSVARGWHLSFAWLFAVGALAFGLRSLVNRHLRRDLLPSVAELHPSHVWSVVKGHARLRISAGPATRPYNVLQKVAYLVVLILLVPGLILTGMTMSPHLNAALPWLLDLFGGRQSARSLHFIFATGLVLFIPVHLLMVVVAGPLRTVRAMITGRQAPVKE